MKLGGRMGKKLRRNKRQVLQLAGLGALALTTAGVVGYALQPAPMAPVATLPSPKPSITKTVAPSPIVAFLGDSYTAGTGADPVTARWTTQVANTLGWTEANFGQGGTGYAAQGPTPPKTAPYTARIADVARANPSIVIVSGGRNDLSVRPGQAEASIVQTFTAIRAALPSARIVALNPLGDDDVAPPALDALGVSIKGAVESVGGVYVESGQPLAGHTDFVISDGVHPNTNGHAAIAKAVAAALK